MRISEGRSCVRGKEMTLQRMEDPGKSSFGASGLGFSSKFLLKDPPQGSSSRFPFHLVSLSLFLFCKTIPAMFAYFSLKSNYVK